MSENSVNSKTVKFTVPKVLTVKEEARNMFREKREQRQILLKAKIEAQRKERNGSKDRLVVKPIEKKPNVQRIATPAPRQKPPTFPKKTNGRIEIKPTRASQLRAKQNELHGLDKETIRKIMEMNRKSNTETTIPKSTQRQPRRSISQDNLNSKPKLTPSLSNQAPAQTAEGSQNSRRLSKARSEENIRSTTSIMVPSPIVEEEERSTNRNVMFQTPARQSIKFKIGSTPAPSELRERLLSWLKKRGKSLNAYNHLRCFGVHQPTPYRPARKSVFQANDVNEDDENKENREELAPTGLCMDAFPKVIDYTNQTTDEILFGTPSKSSSIADMNKLAQDALCDLHSLILEGYPQDHCLEWLSALQRKYPLLKEQAQYWECCAAIGEIKGEFTEALDCYQQAIIKGAQISKIDHSIEKMFEKFSVLKLDESLKRLDSSQKKQRKKTVLDARNIFKSTVIKFAVKERESRLKQGTVAASTPLVAKPVRRSARVSANFSTPVTHQSYTSIKEIETSLHRTVNFEHNDALL